MVGRKLQEIFIAIFGILSYIRKTFRKTEDYGYLKTNHSVRSSLHQEKQLSRSSRMNKTLGYFGLMLSAVDSNEQKKIKYSNRSLEQSTC